MNQNVIIGILVVVILLGGGYYFINMNNAAPAGGTATTTVSTDTGTNTTTDNNVTTATAPIVTTDTGVAPTNSTAVVTGKVTPNGAQTTYWYEYGTSATLGNKTASQAIGSGWTAIPSPGYITGLSANTVYFFRLSAQNAYGTVNGTTYSFSTNNNPAAQGKPPAVTTNPVASVTRGSVTLNGHVNPDSSQTTYWFEYGTTANFGQVTTFQSASDGNGSIAVSAPVSGLNPLTKYYFRINAQNQYGTVNGSTQSFTTSGPASPGVPSADTTSATDVATSTATLNGIVGPNGAETTYWFEYSKDSLLGSILGTASASQAASASAASLPVSVHASNLSTNTRYYYRLVTRNQYGTTRGDIVPFRTTQ